MLISWRVAPENGWFKDDSASFWVVQSIISFEEFNTPPTFDGLDDINRPWGLMMEHVAKQCFLQ